MENMNHDHMHGMMNNQSDGGMTAAMQPHKMMMHMTFFWGSDAQILFSGWPGTSTAMYVLALIVVFLLAFTSEFVSHSRLLKPSSDNHVASGLVQTLLHAFRVGLAYLVMLAIMSFNGGVFLAAVAGHFVGFLLLGSGIFKNSAAVPAKTSDHLPPPLSC
ncbi:Copper transporter 2 [Hibiscus syriacus]|uniref:Copper transport protein n=1 Tax=Hibiscus syriacus TaxID=106335 RepID=A0A6A3ANB2_HIBSY|nr:copper transporter 2-like [Hibiscus syriacus]KAE8705646.1 Copper transporter 2 [Hibiscus syriacus]